jgi:tryprostatin B 6-hydroxylase
MRQHDGLDALHQGMAPLGFINSLPWSIPIFQALPQPAGIDQWITFCDKQIEARKKVSPASLNYMYRSSDSRSMYQKNQIL